MNFSTPSSPASPMSSVSPPAASWGGGKERRLCRKGVQMRDDKLICWFLFLLLRHNITEHQQRGAPSRLLEIMRCYQNTKQCRERRAERGTRSQSGMHIHTHAISSILSQRVKWAADCLNWLLWQGHSIFDHAIYSPLLRWGGDIKIAAVD